MLHFHFFRNVAFPSWDEFASHTLMGHSHFFQQCFLAYSDVPQRVDLHLTSNSFFRFPIFFLWFFSSFPHECPPVLDCLYLSCLSCILFFSLCLWSVSMFNSNCQAQQLQTRISCARKSRLVQYFSVELVDIGLQCWWYIRYVERQK